MKLVIPNRILDLFKTDYYWLVEGAYDPAAMLRYQAPGGSPSKKGQMHIKVLRDSDQFVGFVAYYKKFGSEWKFNFIAVRDEFRGKGYAQKIDAVRS
jgi:ribosomal protein S18 acetylase RimI-like enzyme